MILITAIPGFSTRRALSSSERFSLLSKMILSSVMVNSSALSVDLLGMMVMVTLLTRFPAVKVTSEDAMPPKSSPSEVKKSFTLLYSVKIF